MHRLLTAIFLMMSLAMPLAAQENEPVDRSATGGAPTLEDIMARQNGQDVDNAARRANTGDPDSAAGIANQLGTLGGASDPDLWRALRFGTADVTVSTMDTRGRVLMQDGGMWWLQFREGPLLKYGMGLLAVTLILLAVFFLLRGRIRIEGGKNGRTVERFKFVERMAHWTLAGSFILLGLTGIFTLIGRKFIAPTFGLELNAWLLTVSKFIHNNVSWAFMLALVVVFFMWVWHNIPDRTDITWIKQAGGIVGSKHPPAKKFNFGQKIIFWSVIVLGFSVSLSGLSLLFPYELPLFAKTFGIFNDIGATGLVGLDPLPTQMSPQEEMQYAQLWHAIVAFVMMAIIFGHIYIGTLGMEGAYDAMGSGEVDEAWAEQHHSIWLEEMREKDAVSPKGATPAE
ncbi:formate dehydrogenase subunit gamma [Sulfitobacter sp. S190]|uniref:formate dehydrogenase subunit gamma n=1 Tax=Sulfitobacter sp. S190 TaxID=2867022 RepID=UPI0021A872BD|nr:formate dehydrogenase subunit gamma [Sulfitobacter sp. S190]UWR24413.1 formate dehydrogenase subunit gamma [Sulfitobacter sp. S190]